MKNKKVVVLQMFLVLIIGLSGVLGILFVRGGAKEDVVISFDYELRSSVQVVQKIVEKEYSKYENGELTYEEAFTRAKEDVQETRWNDDRRGFFAISYDGEVLAVPKDDDAFQVGDNVLEHKASDGSNINEEAIKIAKNGGGYFNFVIDRNEWRLYCLPTSFDFFISADYDSKYLEKNWGINTTLYFNIFLCAIIAVTVLVELLIFIRNRKNNKREE